MSRKQSFRLRQSTRHSGLIDERLKVAAELDGGPFRLAHGRDQSWQRRFQFGDLVTHFVARPQAVDRGVTISRDTHLFGYVVFVSPLGVPSDQLNENLFTITPDVQSDSGSHVLGDEVSEVEKGVPEVSEFEAEVAFEELQLSLLCLAEHSAV